MKRPSFQFYPADWLQEPALRICSLAAKGLWIEMICYMHQGNPYGYLKINNKVILPDNLAVMVSNPPKVVEDLLKELDDAGVFQKSEDGVIYSKRMVRDEEIRQARASGGFLGGNPKLLKRITKKDNLPLVDEEVNKDKGGMGEEDCKFFKDKKFSKTWEDYLSMRKKIKKDATEEAKIIALKNLEEYSNGSTDMAIKILENSILNSWQGVFPLKESAKQKDNFSGIRQL